MPSLYTSILCIAAIVVSILAFAAGIAFDRFLLSKLAKYPPFNWLSRDVTFQSKQGIANTGTGHGGGNTQLHTGLGSDDQDTRFKTINERLESLDKRLKEVESKQGKPAGDDESTGKRGGSIKVSSGPPPGRDARGTEQRHGHSAQISAALSDSLNVAQKSYEKFTLEGLRDLPQEPIFVSLDIDTSAAMPIGEVKRTFKLSDNKQTAFVIFRKGQTEGWLFPNSRISFTETMKYVFANLSYDNFQDQKLTLTPVPVRTTTPGTWETL